MHKRITHKEAGVVVTEIYGDPAKYGFEKPAPGPPAVPPADPEDPDSMNGSGE